MDFNVNSNILITDLGAFDSDQNGFAGPITVGIFDRTTQTLVPGLTATITDSLGTLIGGDRFVSLGTPVLLVAGFQGRVVAYGYGAAGDKNGNVGVPSPPFGGNTTNTGGGLITFVGSGAYGVPNFTYPTITDGGPSNRYAAGDFQFQGVVPEPTTMLLEGTAFLGFGIVRRRNKRS